MVQKELNRNEFLSLYPKSLKRKNNEQRFVKEKRAHDRAELLKQAFELGCSVEDLK